MLLFSGERDLSQLSDKSWFKLGATTLCFHCFGVELVAS